MGNIKYFRIKTIIKILLLLAALVVIEYFIFTKLDFFLKIIASLMAFVLIVVLIYLIISSYKENYKEEVLKPYLKELGYEYDPDDGIDEIELDGFGLFNFEYDYLVTEDLVRDETSRMSFAEFSKIITDKGEEFEKILFKGFVYEIYRSVELRNKIVIIPNEKEAVPVVYADGRVKTNSEKFEKEFDVFSYDEDEVMEVLDEELMDKFMKLNREFGIDKIIFDSNRLYIAKSGKSFGEKISILKSVNDKNIEEIIKPVKILDIAKNI